jgi:hypothetical protein
VLLLVLLARVAQLWVAHVGCEQTWDDGAVQLARDVRYYSLGRPIYTDFRRPPYYAQEYGPIIPVLMRPLTRFSGNNVFACLRAGRWLTIGATFAAGLVMVAPALQFSSLTAAAIAVIGFILTPIFFPWFSEFRVDTPALLLEVAGLYAVSIGADPLAIILFVAAFMTKQTYVAGIAAVVAVALWRGDHRRAFKLAAGWLAIAGFAVLWVQWRDPFYVLNAFASHVPLWDWKAPPELLGRIALAMAPLVAMALVALSRRAPAMNLVVAYAIAALALCSVAALRWGSDLNYFLEFAAAIALLAAAGIDALLIACDRYSRIAQVGIGVAMALILAIPAAVSKKLALRSLLAHQYGLPAESCDTGWNPDVFRRLEKTDGPILTALPDINLRLDRQVWAPEFDVLDSMRARGLFDDSELIESISRRRFAAIVLAPAGLDADYRGREFFWPQLRQAIEQNYQPATSSAPPFLLVPKR